MNLCEKMNVLFISLVDFESIQERNIYTDLLREFYKRGHYICAISPIESRKGQRTRLIEQNKVKILKLRIGNTQKTNIIEKGISTVAIERQFLNAIKKYFSDVRFDLVVYPTPPVTFCKVIEYVKKRDGARTYLLLKDIFPQNAVDIGMMKKGSLVYKYFRAKEKKLYRISDRIGCMSSANVKYVMEHNPEIRERNVRSWKQKGEGIVEICPNSIEPVDRSITADERESIRIKYGIPLERLVFIYGGNLGKPQGIDFLLKCLHSQRKNDKAFFVIVGSGTEYGRVWRYMEKYQPGNILLLQWLPKEDYDKVVAACDIGMIFLDHRFTIPNFPSRLLSYMQCKLPVFACTDPNTDIGKIIMEGGFGWWCESGNYRDFLKKMRQIVDMDVSEMKRNAYDYLSVYYNIEVQANQIIRIVSGNI